MSTSIDAEDEEGEDLFGPCVEDHGPTFFDSDDVDLSGLTSPSVIPILAKVECDVDKRKATWYGPWIRGWKLNHQKREQRARTGSNSGSSPHYRKCQSRRQRIRSSEGRALAVEARESTSGPTIPPFSRRGETTVTRRVTCPSLNPLWFSKTLILTVLSILPPELTRTPFPMYLDLMMTLGRTFTQPKLATQIVRLTHTLLSWQWMDTHCLNQRTRPRMMRRGPTTRKRFGRCGSRGSDQNSHWIIGYPFLSSVTAERALHPAGTATLGTYRRAPPPPLTLTSHSLALDPHNSSSSSSFLMLTHQPLQPTLLQC